MNTIIYVYVYYIIEINYKNKDIYEYIINQLVLESGFLGLYIENNMLVYIDKTIEYYLNNP